MLRNNEAVLGSSYRASKFSNLKKNPRHVLGGTAIVLQCVFCLGWKICGWMTKSSILSALAYIDLWFLPASGFVLHSLLILYETSERNWEVLSFTAMHSILVKFTAGPMTSWWLWIVSVVVVFTEGVADWTNIIAWICWIPAREEYPIQVCEYFPWTD